MIVLTMSAAAFAADCTRTPTAAATVDLGGATAMVVRGVEGRVQLTGTAGSEIRAEGTSCAPVKVRLTRKGDVVFATVKGAKDADLDLSIAVPPSIQALTVQDQTGPLLTRALPTRLAVVSSDGPVEVHGAGSLRISYATGPVIADRIDGDVFVDQLTGPLQASTINGSVLVDGIVGSVRVDDVGGDLAVQGTGTVDQSNVRGSVRLP